MIRSKNRGVGPKPCFMVGCLSRGGSLKTLPLSIVPIKRQVENFMTILKMSQYSFMGLLRRNRIVFDL